MLLPLAIFTADIEQIFNVTLDLPVQVCKNASLSLANVAWYVLHHRLHSTAAEPGSSAAGHGERSQWNSSL